MKKYLIDESIFVYLDRKDYIYHTQLVAFLEDARLSKPLVHRRHILYLPHLAKLKLGALRFYGALIFMKKFTRSKEMVLFPLEKADMRAKIARSYVKGYLKLPWLSRLFNHIFPKTLINLYIYSNENKSQYFLKSFGRKISANEVVPLEVCEIALIAKKHKLDILSFNQDFEFLTMLQGRRSAYITYIHPDDLLKEYIGSRDPK